MALAIAASAAGCRRTPPADPRLEARKWFEASTGLALPKTAQITEAKCITVFAVGDTYYLEMTASPELEALLHRDFVSEKAAPSELSPPPEWLKQMPFWTPDKLTAARWFSRRLPQEGEAEWISCAAYDSAAGRCFFVGAQCR